MLKKRGILVLLMCKLEARNFFFLNVTLRASRLGLSVKELSVVKSKPLYKSVKSPKFRPVLKYLLSKIDVSW